MALRSYFEQSDFSYYLALFGSAVAAYFGIKFALSLLSGVKGYILPKLFGVSSYIKHFGTWAVVTGATDGIGKAYAQELASFGLNIVLISRTPEKLSEAAKEIEKAYNVKTKIVPVNFTGGSEIYEVVKSALNGLDIGVLINNVGTSYDHPMFFLEADKQTVKDVINVNIFSVTMMSHIVLPEMEKKKKGLIVNVSSAAGDYPTPLLSIYSATKAYVTTFTQCLQFEYGSKGIVCQNVAPFFVATKMAKIKSASLFVPNPSQYVKAALGSVGTLAVTHGCLSHDIQGWFRDIFPSYLISKISLITMLPVRKKALQRQAKKQ